MKTNEEINKNRTFMGKIDQLIRPISQRSGMVINTPYKHLGSKKRLLIVGFNPGGVPDYSKTTIEGDWIRHKEDISFNAMNESWGGIQEKSPGSHPIQLLYKAFLVNTALKEEDILVTNLYWQRSQTSKKLVVDQKLENICKDGFLLNLEEHNPEAICFLGHQTARSIVNQGWSSICLMTGTTNYPWGQSQEIKSYRMKFNGRGINTFSLPHPSRFGFANDPERLSAILKGLEKCGIDINK